MASKGLTRELVALAAIEVAAAEGVGAVTMLRVGAKAGCSAMSLYSHVDSQRDLWAAMVEQLKPPAVTDALDAAGHEAADVVHAVRVLLVAAAVSGRVVNATDLLIDLDIAVEVGR